MLPFPFACVHHEVTRVAREKNAKFTDSVQDILEQTKQAYYDPLYLYCSLVKIFGPQYLPSIYIAISDLKARGYLEDYQEPSFSKRTQHRDLIASHQHYIKVNLARPRTT